MHTTEIHKSKNNSDKIRLAVGITLYILVTVLMTIILPITMDIKGRYFISSFNFFGGLTLKPFKYLILGWTAMQLLSVAFGIKLKQFNWIRYAKYFLLIVVVLYFIIVLWFWLPRIIYDANYVIQRMNNSLSASYGNPEFDIPQWLSWCNNKIVYYLMYLNLDFRVPVFLFIGAALNYCGFLSPKGTTYSTNN